MVVVAGADGPAGTARSVSAAISARHPQLPDLFSVLIA
jgi:hypothetical protein